MNVNSFCFDGKGEFKLSDCPTSLGMDKDKKNRYVKLTDSNTAKIAAYQDKLYADGREGVVMMLQAMDAAGKDSTIKAVMSGVNPQGVHVTSFKTPTSLELGHDYLWRAITALPQRGYMGIFNRSYYEDVLVVRIHELWKGYSWPKRCYDMTEEEFFAQRFEQIRNFEEYLYQNGYRLLKIFLHESKDTQKKRFLDRIDQPEKNWKFSGSDLKERALFDRYMDAYEETIRHTSTKHNPWYVIPADQKWVTRYLVGEALVKLLEDIDPQYPVMPEEEQQKLAEYREALLSEAE